MRNGLAAAGLVLALIGCSAGTEDLRLSGRDGGTARDAGAVFDADAAFDAGAIFDAGVAADAEMKPPPQPGRHLTLEPREATISLRAADFHENRTAFLTADVVLQHVCELPGPVQIDRAGPFMLEVRAFVWRDHRAEPGDEPCTWVADRFRRDVPVGQLARGVWAVRDVNGGAGLSFAVEGRLDCRSDARLCNADCGCVDGRVCIACEVSSGCEGFCARPCNPISTGCCSDRKIWPDLECSDSETCSQQPAFLSSGSCVPRMEDRCRSDDQCPPGMGCNEGVCVWTLSLNAATRGPCDSTPDCQPGMDCVEAPDGTRSCEVPCLSNTMRCPLAHWCQPESFRTARWVCEWVGD